MASFGLQDLTDNVSLTRSSGLVLVLNTSKGRGVFAAQDIPAQTILDVSPVLVLSPEEFEQHVRHTRIYFYTYNWAIPASSSQGVESSSKPTQTQALPLGLGSLFNHSTLRQNVGWTRDVLRQVITYRTMEEIKKGDELCISYGESGRLGFVDVDAAEMRREEEERLAMEEREILGLGE